MPVCRTYLMSHVVKCILDRLHSYKRMFPTVIVRHVVLQYYDMCGIGAPAVKSPPPLQKKKRERERELFRGNV